ncbi:hypothetical protein [Corallococcus coralloides]|uniref:hypothetical protein n=1 Tax=Corallococcus coralloides TaxID=184914 RepID=UPI0011D22FEF|nr:hypothetical protein [Corallococcus coralloides]
MGEKFRSGLRMNTGTELSGWLLGDKIQRKLGIHMSNVAAPDTWLKRAQLTVAANFILLMSMWGRIQCPVMLWPFSESVG